MSKKVTIKDVAEVAGVCKATVSYVLNNKKDQSISEATQKKVWQVVNMLNYRPNSFAQNMRATQEKRLIAVAFPDNPTMAEKLSYFDFLDDLKGVFRENNYEILLLGNAAERTITADAIIACGLTREEFFVLGDCNLIPLISIDCRIDDPLFFEISCDFRKLKELADAHFSKPYLFVDLEPREETMKPAVREVFPDALFVKTISDIDNVSSDNVLVVQKALKEILSARPSRHVFCPDHLSGDKAAQTVQCIRLALEHEICRQHVFKI